MTTSLIIVAVLFVVTTLIIRAIQAASGTRRVLGQSPAANAGDTTGAVLMASDYGSSWHPSDSGGSSDGGGWSAADCGSGADAGGGGGDCGGGSDGGGGGGAD